MTEQEQIKQLEGRILQFRVRLQEILEEETDKLKLKGKLMQQVLQSSDLTPFIKHDLNSYVQQELVDNSHPLLQFYDEYFKINSVRHGE